MYSTGAAPCLGFAPGAYHRDQVLDDDAPPHISLKACVSFVTGPLHCKLMFQRADPRLNARTPALTVAEPTLLLMVGTFGRQPARGRQHHLGDSQLQRRFFIGRTPEPPDRKSTRLNSSHV